jgi:hypothetical protein
MKEYKVIALNVAGPGNKIYYLGETVYENNFREGRAEELVRLGFLKPSNVPEAQPPNSTGTGKKK